MDMFWPPVSVGFGEAQFLFGDTQRHCDHTVGVKQHFVGDTIVIGDV